LGRFQPIKTLFIPVSINPISRISLRHWRGDLFGGLTAAIVALPLALAFGVASGAGAIAGLYGAIIVGFFAALCGGTPTQVSGPTGPMTVVMTTAIATLIARYPESGLAMAFTAVLCGGLTQILMGLLRLGQYITLIPYAVISGFMSGIGVIIMVLQLPVLLGYTAGSGGMLAALQALPTQISQPNLVALGLGLLTFIIVWAVPPRLNRILPAPLLALVVVTLLSVVVFGDATLARIGPIPTGLPALRWPTLELKAIGDILHYGLMFGLLGAIDSLLTSLVADQRSRTSHDSDQELIGQGIGNLMSGLFGGLPGAGATMRTVVNIQAGGKTPLSGMVHAAVLLLIVLWAGPLTAPIPHAVLAGVLLKVGIDILDWDFIRRGPRLSLKGTGLMYLVLVLTVFGDLITAVLVGAFIANMLTIKRLSDWQGDRIQAITDPTPEHHLSPAEQAILTQAKGAILLLRLSGPLSFGVSKRIAQQMTIAPNYQALIIDLSEVPMLGVAVALAIAAIVQAALRQQRPVWLVVVPGIVQQRLSHLALPSTGQLYQVTDRLQACQSAAAFIQLTASL
jgi:sulfate permease, SulP family